MSNDGTQLFVYGVDKNLTKESIQEEFKKFGAVKDVQNAGKGYAFVSFEKKEACNEAYKGMKKKNGYVSLWYLQWYINYRFFCTFIFVEFLKIGMSTLI